MRAFVFDGHHRLERDYPAPEPGPGEVLARVLKAGICNTDLELLKGYMGFKGVVGHEFVGIVVGGEWDGRRIASEINITCGTCEFCRKGLSTQCASRSTVGICQHNGAFADWITLPVANLHPIPDSVNDDQAIFVEPLAAGLQTLHLTHISPHERVLLLGAGKLGLLTAQVLSLTGCHLTVVGRYPRQLELVEKWGISGVYPDNVEPNSADIVVDCTGTAQGFADALDLVKPLGTIHLKSTYRGLPEADLTRVVVNEIKVVSSRCGPFEAAIRLLARGLVDVESLIEARYGLDDALAAIEHAARRGTLKVVLDIA